MYRPKAPFFSALPKQRGLLPTVWGDVNAVDRGDRRRQRLSTKLTEGYLFKIRVFAVL